MLGRSSTIARRLARRASATSTAVRQHSRSTIGTLPPNQPETPTRYADVNQRNFSASAEEAGGSDDSFERMHLVSLLSAIRDEAAMLVNSNYGDDLSRQRANVAMRANARASKADALDLFQAADAAGDFKKYDKVLILMSNGESKDTKFEADWIDKGGDLCDAESSEEYPIDPLLTGKVRHQGVTDTMRRKGYMDGGKMVKRGGGGAMFSKGINYFFINLLQNVPFMLTPLSFILRFLFCVFRELVKS